MRILIELKGRLAQVVSYLVLVACSSTSITKNSTNSFFRFAGWIWFVSFSSLNQFNHSYAWVVELNERWENDSICYVCHFQHSCMRWYRTRFWLHSIFVLRNQCEILLLRYACSFLLFRLNRVCVCVCDTYIFWLELHLRATKLCFLSKFNFICTCGCIF